MYIPFICNTIWKRGSWDIRIFRKIYWINEIYSTGILIRFFLVHWTGSGEQNSWYCGPCDQYIDPFWDLPHYPFPHIDHQEQDFSGKLTFFAKFHSRVHTLEMKTGRRLLYFTRKSCGQGSVFDTQIRTGRKHRYDFFFFNNTLAFFYWCNRYPYSLSIFCKFYVQIIILYFTTLLWPVKCSVINLYIKVIDTKYTILNYFIYYVVMIHEHRQKTNIEHGDEPPFLFQFESHNVLILSFYLRPNYLNC